MTGYRIGAVAVTMLLAALASRPASAFFLDGARLLTACENSDPLQLGVCLGYIQGVADALDGKQGFCLPRVGAKELREVVVKSLQQNADRQQQPATMLVTQSLAETFACTK
jgi:hypothetical protein